MSNKIVISGANRGIGLEFVRQFLARGDEVFAGARETSSAKELQALKEKNPERLHIQSLDVESESSIENFSQKVIKTWDSLSFLINNAGVFADEHGDSLKDLKVENWLKSFRVNSIGPALMTKYLLPLIQKSSSPKVAHISSLMGSIADNSGGAYYSYRMSKAALNMFNKSLSLELKNAVCVVLHPGWVQTDMGGSNAPTKPEESVKGLIQVLDSLTLQKTGKFLDFKGKEIAW